MHKARSVTVVFWRRKSFAGLYSSEHNAAMPQKPVHENQHRLQRTRKRSPPAPLPPLTAPAPPRASIAFFTRRRTARSRRAQHLRDRAPHRHLPPHRRWHLPPPRPPPLRRPALPLTALRSHPRAGPGRTAHTCAASAVSRGAGSAGAAASAPPLAGWRHPSGRAPDPRAGRALKGPRPLGWRPAAAGSSARVPQRRERSSSGSPAARSSPPPGRLAGGCAAAHLRGGGRIPHASPPLFHLVSSKGNPQAGRTSLTPHPRAAILEATEGACSLMPPKGSACWHAVRVRCRATSRKHRSHLCQTGTVLLPEGINQLSMAQNWQPRARTAASWHVSTALTVSDTNQPAVPAPFPNQNQSHSCRALLSHHLNHRNVPEDDSLRTSTETRATEHEVGNGSYWYKGFLCKNQIWRQPVVPLLHHLFIADQRRKCCIAIYLIMKTH